MDFSGHHQAADMSSADLFEYLLNTDNDASFTSFYPTTASNNTYSTVVPPQATKLPSVQQQPQQPQQRPLAPATRLRPTATTSYTYRQISPSMSSSNPVTIAPTPPPQLQPIAPAIRPAPATVHIKPILPKAAPSTASTIATATAVPTSASALISPALFSSGSSTHSLTAATIPPSEDIWKERFQQLQQIQQMHRHKQHQLLSAALLSSPTSLAPSPTASATTLPPSSSRASQSSSSGSQRGSSSERSVSPEKTATTNDNKLRAIYPSPPMNDDMAMESDSEMARFSHGSEFVKPTESQLKLMTSKERRQLRNKLSARNFRVRRKEYIDHLENEVKLAKQETADIQRRLIQSELNCQFLRQELEATRLSQSLFGTSAGIGSDGRMSREHANLLASLLNPNTETFPTVVPSSNTESVQMSQEAALASTSWMDASLAAVAGTDANGELLSAGAGEGATGTTGATGAQQEEGQVPMAPFVPFDGDWSELLINRAEVSEPVVDPKDTTTTTATAGPGEAAPSPVHELLARYEALKREAELDAEMRAEIKVDMDRRHHLAQTYMVLPKGGYNSQDNDAMSIEVKRRLEEDSMVLKSLIYMLMVQLTESLFEAATLSKIDLVRMYQSMDEPLRAKMLAQSQKASSSPSNKFAEWREGWIKRCWPSYYNNRRRVVELINRTGICDPCYRAKELKEREIEEIARKMEEAVSGELVQEVCKPNFFYKTFVPDRFKCAGVLAYEKMEAEAKATAKAAMLQQEASMRAALSMPIATATSVACA